MNRITSLLGIQYPIIQGGMVWCSGWRLASAVSNAGGLGSVSYTHLFFTKNKVSGFNVNHQGKRDESSFVIGTLATTNGNFRVNCFLKKVQNQYLIHQIRIDKINE